MPQDSITDWIDNEESFYNEKLEMFDRWVEEGDSWSERQALQEARAKAAQFAEAIESMEFTEGKYSKAEIFEAADFLLEEFEEYREEAIRSAVQQATRVPRPEELVMDEGDIAHAKKYEALALSFGIETLQKLIPASREKIRKALERGDKHLNTIPLRKWDKAGLQIRDRNALSTSEKVSLLKHIAVWHYA